MSFFSDEDDVLVKVSTLKDLELEGVTAGMLVRWQREVSSGMRDDNIVVARLWKLEAVVSR